MIIFFFIIFLLPLKTASYEDQIIQLKEDISNTRKKIESIQREIKNKKVYKKKLEEKEKKLKKELEVYRKKLEVLERENRDLKRKEKISKKELKEIISEIDSINTKLINIEKGIRKVFIEFQKYLVSFDYAFNYENGIDAQYIKLNILGSWNFYKRKMEDVKFLEIQKNEREKEIFFIEDKLKENINSRRKVKNYKNKKDRTLKIVSKKKEKYKEEIIELTEKQKELNLLFKKLMKVKKETEWEIKRRKEISKLKGKLPWPVEGKIVSKYGKYKDPKYNTYFINKGIKIKPVEPSFVKSVAKGKVVFAQPFQSYGKTVIIEHGGGYFTVYSYLKSINVKVGDDILGETIIGTVEKEPLYFELRKEGVPVDPLRWLRKRG